MFRFLLLVLVLAAAAGAFAYKDYDNYLSTPLTISDAQANFTVEPGWSAKRVSKALVDQGIIDKPLWFDLYARLSEKSSSIKSGEFILPSNPTVPELFDSLVKGQTKQYTAGIIEGTTFKQLRAKLATVEHLVQTLGEKTDKDIMTELGQPELHPEGVFFADTYSFPKNTSDFDYLKRAHAMLNKVLEEEWQGRQSDLPYATPYEALVLASIVEKETAVAEERPIIAGVFVTRLRKKMRLQTDPTVIYGMGDSYDGNIRRSDLTTDTPYNTYTRGGLPPTPIAMVGREAINAVMHPADTTAVYFVARGDGTHQFSDTLDQHNAAVRKYQLKK